VRAFGKRFSLWMVCCFGLWLMVGGPALGTPAVPCSPAAGLTGTLNFSVANQDQMEVLNSTLEYSLFRFVGAHPAETEYSQTCSPLNPPPVPVSDCGIAPNFSTLPSVAPQSVAQPAIPVGQTVSVQASLTFPSPSGWYCVRARTDALNRSPEIDEGNNTGAFWVYVHAPLPDLTPQAQTIWGLSTTTPSIRVIGVASGNSITIETQVANKGELPAPASTAVVYLNGPGGNFTENIAIPALAVDEIYTFQHVFADTYQLAATYTVGVIADEPELLSELKEDNNEAERSFTVEGDAQCLSVAGVPVSVQPGEDFTPQALVLAIQH